MSGKQLQNRKAGRDYQILDQVEAGIALTGTEVKSLRSGDSNFNDAFARIESGEAWLYHFHIAPYEKGNRENHEPRRRRKLLLHRRELDKLHQELTQKGHTLVPLKGYFKEGRFKVLLGVGKGKTHGDKRQDLKQRDMQRQIDRTLAARVR
ncbi:MAG: SsrA-binding protein SmpB [Candidatus Methylacidiphilales bacterium]